jgi:hypothetical protein
MFTDRHGIQIVAAATGRPLQCLEIPAGVVKHTISVDWHNRRVLFQRTPGEIAVWQF